jgi:putative DNA primase/helicase
MRRPDLNQCRTMLACIPADLDREAWVRIGMALHSEYPGGDGLTLFDEWSERGGSYNKRAVRSAWKSIKPGGVQIGTLIAEAKRHGYTLDRDAPPPDPVEEARRRTERQQREQAEAKRAAEAQKRARREAESALRDAQDPGASEYLSRKRCKAYGVKFAGDVLMVPMCNEAGELWNVQRIAPDGQKRFLDGGRKSGLWHWIGAALATPDAPLLIAEGYATAASLHEATGYVCAVAFDCGNLIHVAKALRTLYRHARIVVCADDDANDKAKHPDGRNPGKDHADKAAQAVRGVVAVPVGLPDGQTDFNDLAAFAGLDKVRECVVGVIPATVPVAPGASTTNSDDGDRFYVNDEGVFTDQPVFREVNGKRTAEMIPVRVCPPLWVRARTRTGDGTEWGYMLAFRDPQGRGKEWVLPARMLAGDGTEYRAQLASLGFESPQMARERRLLTEYIMTRPIDTYARTVRRMGWHDDRRAYVLPHAVIQVDVSEPYILAIDGDPDAGFKRRGTLAQWRDEVAALAVGNSRLVFAIGCAFAGALLEPSQQMGGGFHLKGTTTEGKTGALLVGGSVWGSHAFKQSWRATDSALEWVCASRCDSFLPLDELKEIEPTKIGQCAYMIANGSGKARSNQGGANRHRHEWRVLFLSSGEISVQDHIRDGNGKTHAGQEVRVPDIPSNAGAGHGIFDVLHGQTDGKAFAELLGERTREYYGEAGPEFVKQLSAHAGKLGDIVRDRVRDVIQAWDVQAAAEVRRTADRFALVAVAGEMATRMGLTGWADGEARAGAYACFLAWCDERGGFGSRDDMETLAHVRRMIAMHGRGRYVAWERANDSKAPNVPNSLGWRRKLSVTGAVIEGDEFNATGDDDREVEFVHSRDVFRQEFCQGREEKRVLDLLKKHGHLRHAPNRNVLVVRLPGMGDKKYAQCIVVKASILSGDGEGAA